MPRSFRRLAGAVALLALPVISARAQRPSPLGDFEGQSDVGRVRHPGSASYDAARQRYLVAGAGANMWDGRDDLHFVWKRMRGDFILTARARFLGAIGQPHRKMGWTVRASLDSTAPHASAVLHGDGLAALQFRRAPGATTEEIRSPVHGADVVRLERRGDTFIMSVARFGDTLTTTQVADLPLGDDVYVGLFVCAHDSATVERAAFSDVRITVPAAANFVPYRDYLGSRLELLDVTSGDRTVVQRSPRAMQAPNWTRDGKALVYNVDGRLERFDLATRRASVIPTGEATRNNNDHVLSFDGRTLGISNHSPSDSGVSIVYTVPLRGGTPHRVTARGPSYLHGWSPDGRSLVFTGQRDGEFDVYRIPAAGGAEVRLTTTKGLDDGPEYSPDGRYIYFNSVRSGRMQLWRMRADGSHPEQLTDDEYNNWFPHLSPDGKWIVFISFPKEVDPSDHPWYKHVYLRLMPAGGGAPRVIAYVYGGQGTINVPSWSPDGRRVAFVSNSATP